MEKIPMSNDNILATLRGIMHEQRRPRSQKENQAMERWFYGQGSFHDVSVARRKSEELDLAPVRRRP
jgi:hypothetical protein